MRPHSHIPKPFNRSSIAIQPRNIHRQWQTVAAETLAAEDTVANRGKIMFVTRWHSPHDQKNYVRLTYISNQEETMEASAPVFAFTEAQSG